MRAIPVGVLAGSLVLLLGVEAAIAETRIFLPGDAGGDEIRNISADFLRRVMKADTDGAKGLFGGAPEQQELLNVYMRLAVSCEKLRPAIEGQIGKLGEADLPPTFNYFMSLSVASMPLRAVAVNGDTAVLAEWSLLDRGLRLKRIGGQWKVTHLVIREAATPVSRDYYKAMADWTDAVLAKAAAGQIKTIESFVAELDTMEKRVTPAYLAWLDAALPNEAPVAQRAGAAPATNPADGIELDASELHKLLGQHATSDDVTKVFAKLPSAPLLSSLTSREGSTLDVLSEDVGIGFAFPKEPTLKQVVFFAGGAGGIRRFVGKLPEGLAFTDRRREVERKIGRPLKSRGGTASAYQAEYPHLGLRVVYENAAARDPENPIYSIVWRLPEANAPRPQRHEAPRPRLAFRLVARAADAGEGTETLADPDDDAGRAMLPVSREVLLDESAVSSIAATLAEPGKPDSWAVSIEMTAEGAQKLAKITGANVGRRLAVVFDGRILIAPTVQGVISDRVLITLGTDGRGHPLMSQIDHIHAAITALPEQKGK